MPEDNTQTNNQENKDNGGQESKYGTFEEYLATLDKPVKDLYEQHTHGLKTALEKEREDRKKLKESFDSLKSAAEKGSELEGKLRDATKLLEEADARYQEVERRANFTEQAIKPEIGCTNVRAAYALAVSENLFDSKQNPDWKSIKSAAPELFKSGKFTDAGKNNKSNISDFDMNAALRRAAGLKES